MKLLSEAIEQYIYIYIYIYARDWRLVSVSECWDRELTGATRVKFSRGGVGFGLRALCSWPCSSNHFDFFLHNNLNGLEWRMDPSTPSW